LLFRDLQGLAGLDGFHGGEDDIERPVAFHAVNLRPALFIDMQAVLTNTNDVSIVIRN